MQPLVKWIFLFLMGLVQPVFSQPSGRAVRLFEKGEEAYLRGDLEDAERYAIEAVQKDSFYYPSHLLLADIYRVHGFSPEAEARHLEFVWNHQQPRDYRVGYRLGESWYKTGHYQKCLDVLRAVTALGKGPSSLMDDVRRRMEHCRFAVQARKNPVAGEARKVEGGINTSHDEYWPSISIDGKIMVFTRLMEAGETRSYRQEDLYISRFEDGLWREAVPVEEINTPENEGAQTLSADGNLLFFTACNRPDGLGSCDLYFTRRIGDRWAEPRNAGAPVNTGAWESQPSLSANTGMLYFASNRKGGKGKMDLWRCELKGLDPAGNPVWGSPQNLGDSINTPGNELSPFIHFNGRDLYFSSDYLTGMGGQDLFVSRLKDDSLWSRPQNLGYPVNSASDEQGLVISASGETAYYASDRDGNRDIFVFDVYPEARPMAATYVKGTVKDQATGKPLIAHVEFVNLKSRKRERIQTASNGTYLMALPLQEDYALTVSREGYLFHSESFKLKGLAGIADPFRLDIYLQPLKKNSRQVLRNIYFETDSYTLLPESQPELEKLISLLMQNPRICVEIEGHTDSVGSEAYNQELSEKRAESVVNYLMHSGISGDRLSSRGFGFSRPLAGNDTEEGRARNRRTEIRITQVDE